MLSLRRALSDFPLKRELFILVCIAIIGSAAFGFERRTDAGIYTLGLHEPQDKLSTLFKGEIETYGADEAYARFGKAMHGVPEAIQHEYAHQFGSELYKLEGEAGMDACDPQFHFGCFHQFLSMAIEDNGIEAVDRLYKQCGEIMGQNEICQHGLGHGIQAMFGYSESDLKQALDVCDPLQGDEPLIRCDGGVFMEYNIHTIQNVEGVPGIREVVGGDYMAPCDAVDDKFRYSCLYWLPQWWFASSPVEIRDPERLKTYEAFTEMGQRCAKSEYPRACYEGIGYIMISASGFNPDRARDICDAVGTKNRGNLYCRSMAGAIFSGADSQRDGAPRLCDGLNDADRAFCMAHVNHDGALRSRIPPTEPMDYSR